MSMTARAERHGAIGRLPRKEHYPLRPLVVCSLIVAALLAVGFLALSVGAVNLSPNAVLDGLFAGSSDYNRIVVREIRLPRVVDGMLAGAALAIAGLLLQGVTRNPLADPTIMGVTAAAGLASAAVIVADPQVPQWGIAMACAGGGLVGAGALFVIAWRGAISAVRLALAGVAMSAFFGAFIVALLASSRTFLQTSLGFLAGGLYGAGWIEMRAAMPYFIGGLLGSVLVSGRLNVLSLGDEIAAGLGVLTDRTRLAILGIAGVLTATAVSIAGLVSFVGLVCPHIARYAVGNDFRYLLPTSALIGAILVAGADVVARLVIAPSEIPMGIVTAAIGAPFLLYLLKFRA
jgi:iron complex transport system permease protein